MRNGSGEFLANFKRLPQNLCKKITADGLMEIAENDFGYKQVHILAPSRSYLPNDFGLHHFSGNAAEMLAEPGRTKGGSWAGYGYYIQIDAEDEFAGFMEPSPKIGFRYFMEVLEE